MTVARMNHVRIAKSVLVLLCSLVGFLSLSPFASTATPATAQTRSISISIVGDSLVANREAVYAAALSARGVQGIVDGQGSRALRFGWQCRMSNGLFVFPKPAHAKCKREGLETLRHWSQSNQLGTEIVIALGTNDAALFPGAKTVANLREARRLVGSRKIWIVTVRKLNGSTRPKEWNITASKWCASDGNCQMINWASSGAAGSSANYIADGVHLTPRGAQLRAEFIATSVVGP